MTFEAMKRVVTCPACNTRSRIGPLGQEDGLIEVSGKSLDKLVLHCSTCCEAFLGRMRPLREMKTWQLTDEGQAEVKYTRMEHERDESMERYAERRGEPTTCDVCGKAFVHQQLPMPTASRNTD